jgi:hypothetical protein
MKLLPRLLASAALLAATAYAQAVTLPPGTLVSLPGTTVAAEPQLAGLVLEDVVQPFSFNDGQGTISGTVQSRVVRSSVDGTLDFYWRVINDASSVAGLGSFRIGNFAAPEYNANWRADGLGTVAPTSAYMFVAPPVGYINFNFSNPTAAATLAPGSESYFILMDTTATNYAKTAIYDLANAGQTHNSALFDTFAPAPAVPEPATYGMMLAGLAAVGVAAKRRRG